MSIQNRLTLSYSPQEKGNETVKKIMWGVVIALIPSFISSVYYFGINAIKVTVLSIIFCMGIEFLIQKFLMKVKTTAMDGSAAITGILLAFNLPANIPVWQLFVGSLVAVGIAKLAFGGLGKNPFNPALIGRAFMLASFPVQMTTWPIPLNKIWDMGADATTGATALGQLMEKGVANLPKSIDLILGNVGGALGETSVIAILLGGIYLLYRKIITWHIPFLYLISLFIFTGIFYLIDPKAYADPAFHLISGGAMLGAWFMATDMVTSPMTPMGQIIFAVSAGILCGAIRLFGAYPEGCSYSILIMNAFVPIIDKYCKPKRFGKEVNYG
jgi:electron transport complex protein RnfD